VVFPAVRYLVNATQEHKNRLKLQNWLLLALRTLLVVALVLAAAGPTLPGGGAGHAPSAMVLVVDNSPSSGAMLGGVSQLRALQNAARAVLGRATPADALWLVTADGLPRRGDAAALGRLVDSLRPAPNRLDLGRAVALADEVLAGEPRPGEIVLLTDLQVTSLGAARPRAPVLVGRPAAAPPPNAGVGRLDPGPQPWPPEGGRVTVGVLGDSGAPATPVAVRLGDRPPRQTLLAPGASALVTLPAAASGWWTVHARLDADEFRLDDERVVPVRVAPPARVTWDPSSRHVAAAAGVLEANRRIVRGDGVTLGSLGPGMSIVEPPADPATLGALNRALQRRGVAWRFGPPSAGAATTDSGALVGRVRVSRRHALEPVGASGRTGVLATAGGAPWIVRSGDVILLGSRLDPEWTELPLSAGFMPFMDALLNRVARGEVMLVAGAPGEPTALPDLVTEVRRDSLRWPVEGGGRFRAPEPGVYFLLAEADTVGALAVNPDARESRLARAEDGAVRRLWPGSRVLGAGDVADAAFQSAARSDLRGPLLWLALLLGLAEVAVASGLRRRA
jgi:hypothetical protein